MKKQNLHRIFITIVIALFYCNSLTLHYALDDRMVILESKQTIKGGWDSAKQIFSTNTFSAFFGKENSIVAGGRYRPMSQFLYMIECQIFGHNIKDKIGNLDEYSNLHKSDNETYFYETPLPFVNHLFNLLYYILLCLLLYEILSKIFPDYSGDKWYQSIPFVAVLLFAIHPIHTEVVANVKGRDEILAMLGAFAAVLFSLEYINKRKWYYLIFSFLGFTFGIFSKENAITFLAILPLVVYYYNSKNKRNSDYFITLIPLILGSAFFIIVRTKVLGAFMPPDLTDNILNNPYINATKSQQIATTIFTWAIYLKLLLFPHPLTHDYYPLEIDLVNFSNPIVLLMLAFCIFIIIFAIIKLKSKNVISFGILYFIVTFSITSNLIFNVGTFMNERFVFMPSFGFTIIIAFFFYKIANSYSITAQKLSLSLLGIVLLLFGIKTFTRNLVWYDDFTLFTTDVKTSANSIKCNVSAGGSYLQEWKKSKKDRDKKNAYKYLEKALELDKYSTNGYMLLAELAFLDNNFELSHQAAYNATLIDPQNEDARNMLSQIELGTEMHAIDNVRDLLNAGRNDEALREINRILDQNPDNILAKNMKGNVLGRGFNKIDDAIAIYNEIINENPAFSSAWENLGICYAIKKDFANSERCFIKALALDPENQNIKDNLQKMRNDAER